MKKLLAVVVIWAVILGGAGGAYYYLFYNKPADGPVADGGDKDKTPPDKDKTPPDKDKTPPAPTGKKLRMSGDSFSGYCIFRSDEFKKKLAARGYDFEWVMDDADYAKRMAVVQSGDAPGGTPLAVYTLDALINNTPSSGDPPATVIMAIDETRGADAMVGLAGMPDLDALNHVDDSGKSDVKIVLVENSPSETLTRVVRSQFSLPNLENKSKSEYLIPAKDDKISDVYEQFLRTKQTNPKEHKAFVLWEPYVSKAKNEGAHVLVDSSQFAGYIVDVLIAQRTWLRDHPADAQAVVASYLEVLHEKQATRDGMANLVKDDSQFADEKLNADQAKKVADGIWWKNTVENFDHFGLLPPGQTGNLQRVGNMVDKITAALDKTREPGAPPVTVARPDKMYDSGSLQALHDKPPAYVSTEHITVQATAQQLSDGDWAKLLRVGKFKEDPIQFVRTKAEFSNEEDAQATLADVYDKLRLWPQYYLRVEGNTQGDDNEDNRKLVTDRANAVKNYLVKNLGVPEYRIRAVGNPPGQGKEVDFVMLQKAP